MTPGGRFTDLAIDDGARCGSGLRPSGCNMAEATPPLLWITPGDVHTGSGTFTLNLQNALEVGPYVVAYALVNGAPMGAAGVTVTSRADGICEVSPGSFGLVGTNVDWPHIVTVTVGGVPACASFTTPASLSGSGIPIYPDISPALGKQCLCSAPILLALVKR